LRPPARSDAWGEVGRVDDHRRQFELLAVRDRSRRTLHEARIHGWRLDNLQDKLRPLVLSCCMAACARPDWNAGALVLCARMLARRRTGRSALGGVECALAHQSKVRADEEVARILAGRLRAMRRLDRRTVCAYGNTSASLGKIAPPSPAPGAETIDTLGPKPASIAGSASGAMRTK